MSFSSLPASERSKDACGEQYTEYDGREGAFPARCSRPKGHQGVHGWGSPDEWALHDQRVRLAAVPEENTP